MKGHLLYGWRFVLALVHQELEKSNIVCRKENSIEHYFFPECFHCNLINRIQGSENDISSLIAATTNCGSTLKYNCYGKDSTIA
jgi:hypothetical protein